MRVSTIIGLALLGTPIVSHACPVCFGGGDPRVTYWYIASAVALSILPLTMIGSFAYWLRKRVRADRLDDVPTPLRLVPLRPDAR